MVPTRKSQDETNDVQSESEKGKEENKKYNKVSQHQERKK